MDIGPFKENDYNKKRIEIKKFDLSEENKELVTTNFSKGQSPVKKKVKFLFLNLQQNSFNLLKNHKIFL